MVVLAVKVTDVPAVTGLAEATMLMLAVNGFTVIVTLLEVTVALPVKQVAVEVITQVITSLLTGL